MNKSNARVGDRRDVLEGKDCCARAALSGHRESPEVGVGAPLPVGQMVAGTWRS